MLTREIRKCGHRVGYAIVDLASGEEAVLAHTHHRNGPRIGKYTVDVAALERVGIPAIYRAVEQGHTVIIDELAPMELCSEAFVPAVEAALASGCSLIVSTHAKLDHPLAHRVRQELKLFRVKMSNRDQLPTEILQRFREENAASL